MLPSHHSLSLTLAMGCFESLLLLLVELVIVLVELLLILIIFLALVFVVLQLLSLVGIMRFDL